MLQTRYLRLISADTSSGVLALRRLSVLAADGTPLSAVAVTSTVPPSAGVVAALHSEDAEVRWPVGVLRQPGFAVVFDFGTEQQVSGVEIVPSDASDWPRNFILQSQQSGGWVNVSDSRWPHLWPGAGVLQLSLPTTVVDGDVAVFLGSGSEAVAIQDAGLYGLPVVNNGVVLSRADEPVAGAGSLYFSGSSYLLVESPRLNLSAGDFYFEAWVKPIAAASLGGSQAILHINAGSFAGFHVHRTNAGFISVDDGTAPWRTGTRPVPLNAWTHVAVSRHGGITYLFVNGVLDVSAAGLLVPDVTRMQVGMYGAGATVSNFKGYISGVFLSKGAARTAAFAVPTQPLLLPPYDGPLRFAVFGQSDVFKLDAEDAFAIAHERASARVDMEIGGSGSICGTVELYAQSGNIPLPRRVRLHRSRDGLLVRETWSDAQGNYRFDGITDRYKYDVIAWDHEGLQQSVVANDLAPEPMQ